MPITVREPLVITTGSAFTVGAIANNISIAHKPRRCLNMVILLQNVSLDFQVEGRTGTGSGYGSSARPGKYAYEIDLKREMLSLISQEKALVNSNLVGHGFHKSHGLIHFIR